jgi:hypothetical protein
MLLVDLGDEEIADDALTLMLAFDGGGHNLIEGGLHAVELELAHEVEKLSPSDGSPEVVGNGHNEGTRSWKSAPCG